METFVKFLQSIDSQWQNKKKIRFIFFHLPIKYLTIGYERHGWCVRGIFWCKWNLCEKVWADTRNILSSTIPPGVNVIMFRLNNSSLALDMSKRRILSLNGLPGLSKKAEDEERNIYFNSLVSFENTCTVCLFGQVISILPRKFYIQRRAWSICFFTFQYSKKLKKSHFYPPERIRERMVFW